MVSFKKLPSLLLLFCAASLSFSASADVIKTFDVSGTFTNGFGLTGAMTFNTTTGSLQAFNLNIGGINQVFSGNGGATQNSSTQEWGLENYNTAGYMIDLGFHTTSLIGYNGGALSSKSTPWDTVYASAYMNPSIQYTFLNSGELSIPAHAVPAPPAWLTMLTGLIILVPFYRKHVKAKRKDINRKTTLAA